MHRAGIKFGLSDLYHYGLILSSGFMVIDFLQFTHQQLLPFWEIPQCSSVCYQARYV